MSIFFIFDYRKSQKWVEKMMEKDKGRNIVLIDMLAGFFGMIILVFSMIIHELLYGININIKA